jgi:Tfp pilus assembly protein PilF
MNDQEPDERAPKSSPKGHGSSNVYHKQAAPARSRFRHVEYLETAPQRGGASRAAKKDPIRDGLKTNMKRFAFFVIAMCLLLAVSVKVIKTIWSVRDRRAQSQSSEKQKPPVPFASAVPMAPPGGQPPGLPHGVPGRPVEPSKKAAFLAQMGKAFETSGRIDEAVQHYSSAIAEWPDLPDVWVSLGKLHLQRRDYTNALEAFQQAVNRGEANASILNDLGVVCLHLGDAEGALTNFASALAIDPAYAPSYFNRALGLLAQGRRSEADEALTGYLTLKPGDARGLREKATLAAMTTNYTASIELLSQAMEASPDWPLPYFDAAAVAALSGNRTGAIAYLNRAEPLTSPGVVYRFFQQQAFRDLRLSEEGKKFESDLAHRAKMLAKGAAAAQLSEKSIEPIPSPPPAP